MGKFGDALERHEKGSLVRLEEVKQEIPKRLAVPHPEATVLKKALLKGEFSDKLVTLSESDSVDAETFKVLRGQILFPRDRRVPKSILVTSALPGEGKPMSRRTLP